LQRYEDLQLEDEEEAEDSAKRAPELTSRLLCALLQSVLVITLQLEPLPDGRTYSTAFLQQLSDALRSSDPAVRRLVHQIFQELLTRGGWLEFLRDQANTRYVAKPLRSTNEH
jgi:hypothetical protein